MTDIQALNAIITQLGGSTAYTYNIDAYNGWSVLQGGTGTYTRDIDALNAIDVLNGGAGGHRYNIDALNSITLAAGGTGGYIYDNPALVALATLLNPLPDLDMLFEVNNDLTITDSKGTGFEPTILNPCYNFDGSANYMIHTALLDAYEVEFTIKTASTSRMGVIGVNGFGTVILSNNIIIAGVANVTGNAAAGTYANNVWHTIKIRKTATTNVFDIYLDGNILTKSGSGNWRTSIKTVIGGANDTGTTYSLPLNGTVGRIVLRDVDAVDLNEWRFIGGEYSRALYDCVGSVDFTIDPQFYTIDANAADIARTYGASLIIDSSGNLQLLPFKNGVKRDISAEVFTTELAADISDILPCVAYGINFNPTSSSDSKLDIFDRSDTTIFENFARLDYISAFVWKVSDLDRIQIISWYKTGYQGRVFPKLTYHELDKPYKIEEIIVTTANATDQTNIIKYTKDTVRVIGTDANDNTLLSLNVAKANVLASFNGGLCARLTPTDATADIFDAHGYHTTFVIRTPAQYKADAVNKALFADLQARGHDLGYWYDETMSCIRLYDTAWADTFNALDAALLGTYDEYGSPLWGVAEIFTYDSKVYMGLNPQVKYKIDDAVIVPVHGSSNIKINNLPTGDANTTNFLVLMPDDAMIPVSIRLKWMYAIATGTGGTSPATREFEIRPYEYVSINSMGIGTFSNAGAGSLVTSVGLDLTKVGANYTAFNRQGLQTNGPNERARYYNYLHAIMAFEAMGLERPYTIGEPRNIVDEISLNTDPLIDLDFIAGGTDPVNDGHTFYMEERHRFNISTITAPTGSDPITDTNHAIGIENGAYTAAQAFTKVLQCVARKKIINERQDADYDATKLAKWEDLLALCEASDVPVYSQREAMELIFDNSVSPYINPVPLVHIDTNSKGTPDGYNANASGTDWAVNAGVGNVKSGNGYFHRTTNGVMFTILALGGICPGRNQLKCWVKGKIGDVISVVITARLQKYTKGIRPDSTDITITLSTITFTATQADTWENLLANKAIIIPRNAWYLTFTASLVKSGTAGDVYTGQMSISR